MAGTFSECRSVLEDSRPHLDGSGCKLPEGQTTAATKQIQVRTFSHRTTYDLRYAIPALVFLSLYVAIILSALFLWILRRARFSYLKSLLNQTATGRAVTADRLGEQIRTLSTNKWIKAHGNADISIRKDMNTHTQDSAMVADGLHGGAEAVHGPLVVDHQDGVFHAMTSDKSEIVPHVREMRQVP